MRFSPPTSYLKPVLASILAVSISGLAGMDSITLAARTSPRLEINTNAVSDDASLRSSFSTLNDINPSTGDTGNYGLLEYSGPTYLKKAPSYDPRATQEASTPDDGIVLKGSVEKEFKPDVTFGDNVKLGKGEKLILQIQDVIASGYSYAGDDVHAVLKEAVERDGKLILPKGSLVRGHLATMDERAGKRFNIQFDYILTPDGRKIPLNGDYTRKDSVFKVATRVVTNGVSGTIKGGVTGALMAIQYGGPLAFAAEGAPLAILGGLGAAGGLVKGVAKSGDRVELHEGDTIKVALNEPLDLPSMTQAPDTVNEILSDELKINVKDFALTRDPFKTENVVQLTLDINNQSTYSFGALDMTVMDEYGAQFQLSPFTNADTMFSTIEKGKVTKGQYSFSVQNPQARHYLVFYQPYTRNVITKVSLTEAIRKIYANHGNGKTKKSRRNASDKDA